MTERADPAERETLANAPGFLFLRAKSMESQRCAVLLGLAGMDEAAASQHTRAAPP